MIDVEVRKVRAWPKNIPDIVVPQLHFIKKIVSYILLTVYEVTFLRNSDFIADQ